MPQFSFINMDTKEKYSTTCETVWQARQRAIAKFGHERIAPLKLGNLVINTQPKRN